VTGSRSRIRSCEMDEVLARPGGRIPDRLPQAALAGRSNVGKSSLVNALTGRKSLARVSGRPGRTQQIHFYRADDRFHLVDLPGYGFAKAPPDARDAWARLLEWYLGQSRALAGVVLLLDARRGLTAADGPMLDMLAATGAPTLFVLTKIDKLNRSGRQKAVRAVRDELEISADQVLATSARTGEGVGTLVDSLLALVDSFEREGA
jgi:GTP-binding protein